MLAAQGRGAVRPLQGSGTPMLLCVCPAAPEVLNSLSVPVGKPVGLVRSGGQNPGSCAPSICQASGSAQHTVHICGLQCSLHLRSRARGRAPLFPLFPPCCPGEEGCLHLPGAWAFFRAYIPVWPCQYAALAAADSLRKECAGCAASRWLPLLTPAKEERLPRDNLAPSPGTSRQLSLFLPSPFSVLLRCCFRKCPIVLPVLWGSACPA